MEKRDERKRAAAFFTERGRDDNVVKAALKTIERYCRHVWVLNSKNKMPKNTDFVVIDGTSCNGVEMIKRVKEKQSRMPIVAICHDPAREGERASDMMAAGALVFAPLVIDEEEIKRRLGVKEDATIIIIKGAGLDLPLAPLYLGLNIALALSFCDTSQTSP